MATIGSSLTSPESGWTRFDNTNSLIKYTGSLFKHDNAHTLSYGKTLSYIPSGNTTADILTHKIEFSFIGTKLRIIGVKYKDYSASFSISVDGVEQIISLTSSTTDGQYQILLCEFSGLEDAYHKVEMKSLDGLRYTLDCVDIDNTGYLCDERVIPGEGSTNVSYTKAFHAQTIPMNTTAKILAKTNDSREGLLGMANDAENYGDLYVVGNDGKAHLTKSGIKSEVIFEGRAGSVLSYQLSSSIKKFKYLTVSCNVTTTAGDTREASCIVHVDSIKTGVSTAYHYGWGMTNYPNIAYGFNDNELLLGYISVGSYQSIQIIRVVGLY